MYKTRTKIYVRLLETENQTTNLVNINYVNSYINSNSHSRTISKDKQIRPKMRKKKKKRTKEDLTHKNTEKIKVLTGSSR